MPKAPGFAFRTQTAVASGTTSLTIAAPSPVPVDDDTLLLGIIHQGADWATVPAGFSVIERVLQGTHRVELHWKRASSESGTYSVTGLATFALGAIIVYEGALESGQIVEASSGNGNASGNGTSSSITPPSEHALMAFLSAADANVDFSSHGCDLLLGSGAIDWTFQQSDPDLFRVSERVESDVAGGKLVMGDAIKVIGNKPSGSMYAQWSSNPATVCLMAAITPRTTDLAGAATHYYPSTNAPRKRIDVDYQGAWRGQHLAATVGLNVQRTLRLSQRRGANGQLVESGFVTNQQGNYDVVTLRFMSPPLEEQTLGGTFDLRWPISQWWDDFTVGIVDSSVVRTKAHIYFSKGETAEVRSVLLANHVDSVAWPYSATSVVTGTGLAGPPSLTSQTCQDGDCLCLELGLRIVSSPTPTPPATGPDSFTQALYTFLGAAYNEDSNTQNSHAGVPYIDCVLGVTGAKQTPYFIFSQTIVERDPEDDEALPANDTFENATVISEVPFEDTLYDTTRVPQHARMTWYSWVPEESGRYLLAVYGSNYVARVSLYEDFDQVPSVPIGADGFLIESGTIIAMNNAHHTQWWDVVAGRQYWAAVRTIQLIGGAGPASGGATRLMLMKQEAPVEDDLIYGGRHTLLLDHCGIIKSQQGGFEGFAPTGIGIDYGLGGLADLTGNWPTIDNFNIRVYVALHDSAIIEIIDAFDLNAGRAEIDFISELGAVVEEMHTGQLFIDRTGHTDGAGRIIVGNFGAGYYHVSRGAIGVSAGTAYLSNQSETPTESDAYVRTAGVLEGASQAGSPWGVRPTHAVSIGVAAPSCVSLAPDNNRILYVTTPAWYWATTQTGGVTKDLRAVRIQRWDLDSQSALTDIATLTPEPGGNPGLKGLFALPSDKGVLVCNGDHVLWVSLAGEVLRVYRPIETARAQHLVAVEMTHDFRNLWVMDHASGWLFQFDLFSAAQQRTIPVYQTAGVGSAFKVYLPNGYDTICW